MQKMELKDLVFEPNAKDTTLPKVKENIFLADALIYFLNYINYPISEVLTEGNKIYTYISDNEVNYSTTTFSDVKVVFNSSTIMLGTYKRKLKRDFDTKKTKEDRIICKAITITGRNPIFIQGIENDSSIYPTKDVDNYKNETYYLDRVSVKLPSDIYEFLNSLEDETILNNIEVQYLDQRKEKR